MKTKTDYKIIAIQTKVDAARNCIKSLHHLITLAKRDDDEHLEVLRDQVVTMCNYSIEKKKEIEDLENIEFKMLSEQ